MSFNGSTSQTANVTAGLRHRGRSPTTSASATARPSSPRGLQPPVDRVPATSFGNSGILPAGIASYPSTRGGPRPSARCGPSCPATRSGPAAARTATRRSTRAVVRRPYTPAKGSTTDVDADAPGPLLLTSRARVPGQRDRHGHYAGSGSCPAGDSVLVLGTSDGSGDSTRSLPYGAWTLSAQISGQTVTIPVDVTSSGPVVATLNGTV